jgi:CRP/FNR family transcriptional regulator
MFLIKITKIGGILEIIDIMRKSNLFQFLEEEILQNIIKKSTTISEYETGQVIFEEDQKAQAFYLVLEGKVRISRIGATGKEVILKSMQVGDSFAEIILFESDTYPATATVQEKSKILCIKKKPFQTLLEDKDVSKTFIVNLFKRVRFLAKKIELLTRAEVPERFYDFIETNYGKVESITVRESKKEIATMIGTIPETFSRMIRKLKDEKKIVSWDKNRLVLKKGFWSQPQRKH